MHLSKYEISLHKALLKPGPHTVDSLAVTLARDFSDRRDMTTREVELMVENILSYFCDEFKWVKRTTFGIDEIRFSMTVKGRAKEEPPKRKPRPPLKASR